MTVQIIVQPEAEADLSEAFVWYEAQRPGLGHELLEEADHAFTRISESPLRCRKRYRETRRVQLRRFPYVVLYVLRQDRVFVLAVFHERRDPKRFRTRARTFAG